MTTTAIIIREENGIAIGQRRADGYINATALCQAAGKRWHDYRSLEQTQAFLTELSKTTRLPITSQAGNCGSALIEARSGRHGGTWIHPLIAGNIGPWLSAKFAVLVAQWVFELLTTGGVHLDQQQPPDHIVPHHYFDRLSFGGTLLVPAGHWCIFNEVGLLMLWIERDLRLPVQRFDLADGSAGIHWSRFRRGQPWALEAVRYPHTFPDKRGTQPAWAYRDEELPEFRRWFRDQYVLHHLAPYLIGKYPTAARLLATMPPPAAIVGRMPPLLGHQPEGDQ